MPGPAASALTRAHRVQQQQISATVLQFVTRLWRQTSPGSIEQSWPVIASALAELIRTGHDQSTSTAAAYLQAHARLEGIGRLDVDLAPPLPDAQLAISLRVTGPIAFRKARERGLTDELASRSAFVQVSGAASRLVLAGGRGTVDRTVRTSSRIVGYRRVTSGHPCAFCSMLASRGAVYKSEQSADGHAFHDHCHCTAEPMYRTEPEPQAVVDLQARWAEVTRGLSGTDALNAWRRAV